MASSTKWIPQCMSKNRCGSGGYNLHNYQYMMLAVANITKFSLYKKHQSCQKKFQLFFQISSFGVHLPRSNNQPAIYLTPEDTPFSRTPSIILSRESMALAPARYYLHVGGLCSALATSDILAITVFIPLPLPSTCNETVSHTLVFPPGKSSSEESLKLT